MRHRLTLLATLILLAPALVPAATVRVDFPSVHDTPMGESLLIPLTTGDAAVDDTLERELQRVVISWEGRKCPPTVRYVGINALAVVHQLLAGGAEAIETPWGEGAVLAQPEGYALAIAGPREAVLASRKRIGGLELGELPPPSDHVLEIDAGPEDFKLGNAAKRIDRLHLRWSRTNRVRLTSYSQDADQATWVKSFVNRRLPWLRFADNLGVDAADYPARLLDDRKVERSGTQAWVDLDLADAALRAETWVQLRKLIDKQTRKYRNN